MINIQNVSFSYGQDKEKTLENVSVHIPRGSVCYWSVPVVQARPL